MAQAAPRETSEFPPMMRRLFAAHARRVGDGDVYDLREMCELTAALEAAIATAVAAGRKRSPEAWSWANIADALRGLDGKNVTRQGVAWRWGKASS